MASLMDIYCAGEQTIYSIYRGIRIEFQLNVHSTHRTARCLSIPRRMKPEKQEVFENLPRQSLSPMLDHDIYPRTKASGRRMIS